MTHEELKKTEEYVLVNLQLNMFTMVSEFMKINSLTKEQTVKYLDISPNKLKNILNGDYDGKMSEWLHICVKCGLTLADIDKINHVKEQLIKGKL